jgi:hypothetical protein
MVKDWRSAVLHERNGRAERVGVRKESRRDKTADKSKQGMKKEPKARVAAWQAGKVGEAGSQGNWDGWEHKV